MEVSQCSFGIITVNVLWLLMKRQPYPVSSSPVANKCLSCNCVIKVDLRRCQGNRLSSCHFSDVNGSI